MSRNYRGAGPNIARPENALKRADELENVGQKQSALQALHDIITSRKHRTWSKTYESIMFKHIDLVVEMRKRNYGKEALMQYRNMCQQVNINSLEEVIKYFLKKASDKAEEAQSKAAAVTIDVEDLEQDASPEDLMLSYVSGEKSKDRTDRELVTPWFRFLWESYRSVLEILRTNPKLEPLYAMTANKAFQFCLQYKRTAEFRRLCDILRQHLTNLTNRYRDNREAQLDSLQLHLETRFEQLKVACELELWMEAFRSVEDIQALIALAKRAPKQQMMATYYARLTQIFAVSENHLYHAYAWLKLFNFSKSYNKNMTQGDLQLMACSVLLATLSVLPYDRTEAKYDEGQAEQDKERIIRMANILGFAVDSKKDYRNVLSKGALLASVSHMNLLAMVPPEVRSVYELLTSDFSPLELCAKLAPLIEKLNEYPHSMSGASPVKEVVLSQYSSALKQVAVLRLLKQLSEVYSTMNISALAAMVPFASFSEVEAIIVDAVKYDFLQVHIDHRNGTLHFGSQQLESERVRGHLANLAKRLSKALHLIAPGPTSDKQSKRSAAIKAALENMEQEHRRATARKILIEKRKEEQELQLLEAEREEAARRAIMVREAEMAEEKRRREDMLKREKERIERELEERELEEAKALLEAAKKKAGAAGKVLKEGEKLDKKTLMQEALSERIKEQQELERKLAKIAKQLDHLERARREEEVPFLLDAYEKRNVADQQYHEEQQRQFLEAHRAAWETDVVEKRRLAGMVADKEVFQAQIVSRREEEFQELFAERQRQIAEKKAQKKRERELARRKEFVRCCRAALEERVNQLLEEQARQEAERREQEHLERERQLEEIAKKQREREAEIEARMRAEKEKAAAPAAAPAAAAPSNRYVPPTRRPGDAPAGAAEERPREDTWRPLAGRPSGGREEGDRWSRGAGGPPPPRDDGDRWGRRDTGSGGGAGPAPSKFVPPSLRSRDPEQADRDRRPSEPPSDGGSRASGSAYRPPNRR